MQAEKLNKQVELLSGSFTPNEVGDLILKSIDQQINTYKLQNLSNWIHDHNCDQESCMDNIARLQKRKRELQGLISEAKSAGCNLKLSEKIDIKLDRQDREMAMS
jgi:hypothetical protein